MDASNLGIMFGPTILRKRDETIDVASLNLQNAVVSTLIMSTLFREEEEIHDAVTQMAVEIIDEIISNSQQMVHQKWHYNILLSIQLFDDPSQTKKIAAAQHLSTLMTSDNFQNYLMSEVSKEDLVKLLRGMSNAFPSIVDKKKDKKSVPESSTNTPLQRKKIHKVKRQTERTF